MRKGIMALEELVEVTHAEPVEVVAVTDESSVENTHAKLQQSVMEAETANADITKAVEVSSALTEMSNEVENTLGDGGMSEPQARALEVAIEQMRSSLGAPRTKTIFPAMEGFADTKTRQAKTEIALEGIREFASKIWEAIKAAIQKAIAWVMDFVHNLKLNSGALTKRCQQLMDKAKTMTGGAFAPKAGETINSTILKKFLRLAKGETEPGSFAGTLDKHTTLMAKYMGLVDKRIDESCKVVDFAITEIDKIHVSLANVKIGNQTFNSSHDEITVKLLEKLDAFSSGGMSDVSEKSLVSKYGPDISLNGVPFVFGNDLLVFATIRSGVVKSSPLLISKIGFFVEKRPLPYDAQEKGVEPMTPEQCVKTLSVVSKHLSAFESNSSQLNKTIADLKKAQNTMFKGITDIQRKTTYFASQTQTAQYKAYGYAHALVRIVLQMITTGRSSLQLHDYSTLKHALSYSAASLAACERAKETVDEGTTYGGGGKNTPLLN